MVTKIHVCHPVSSRRRRTSVFQRLATLLTFSVDCSLVQSKETVRGFLCVYLDFLFGTCASWDTTCQCGNHSSPWPSSAASAGSRKKKIGAPSCLCKRLARGGFAFYQADRAATVRGASGGPRGARARPRLEEAPDGREHGGGGAGLFPGAVRASRSYRHIPHFVYS